MNSEYPSFHGFDRDVVRLGASHLSIRVGRWQFGSPTIGMNGTLYCTPVGDGLGQALKAYSPSGTELWQHEFDTGILRPATGSNGTVYVATSQGQAQEPDLILYAFTKSGKVLWTRSWPLRRSGSAPICDADGVVYIILNRELHKIGPDGTDVWTVPAPGHEPVLLGCNAGQVYALLPEGWQSSIHAFSLDGQELWSLKAPFDAAEIQREARQRLVEKHGEERARFSVIHIMYAPPNFESRAACTPQGNLVIANVDDHFYSISPDGRINWRFNPEKADCIGANSGMAAAYVTWKWGLYAVTEQGELLWKQQQHFTTVPVVGKDGKVCVAGMHEARAFSPSGDLLWIEPIQGIPGPFPSLTHAGQFCVTTDWGYMHLLG